MFGASKIRRLKTDLEKACAKTAVLEERIKSLKAEHRQAAQRRAAELQAAKLEAGNQRALAELLLRQLEIADAAPVAAETLPLPLPPVPLRLRVGNDLAARAFLDFGSTRAAEVSALLRQAGPPPRPLPRLLDFGCGCGRVLRHLPGFLPGWEFVGLDVDAEAVGWCTDHLTGPFHFHVSPDAPPCALPDAQFDAVLALSVFTHLPLNLELQWMAELSRLTKPGGWLLLTFLDEEIMTREGFDPAAALEADEGFFYYQGSVTSGLPDYYKSTYHTAEAVQRLWSPYVEVVSIHPKAINQRQSAALCRPRSV